jgi:hypothetical protein
MAIRSVSGAMRRMVATSHPQEKEDYPAFKSISG